MNKVIVAYIKMRDKRTELKKAFDDEYDGIEDQMDRLQVVMLKHIKDNELKNITADAGTATRGVKTRYWAGDWELMSAFILENDAYELYEKRIAQVAMRTFLKENPDLKPPINVDSKYAITVRRSSK